MLLKSELLTAIPGAQGYHPACTYTPSYHPQPAVHGVYLIGKFVTCSAYLLSRVGKNDNNVNPIKSVARNSQCRWRRYR